jgi:hypothetical protein
MALKAERGEHVTAIGNVPHDALVRVEARVKEILARREVAVRQARLAARRLKRS